MSDLRTKTSRQRLKPRGSFYIQILASGRALGYRRRTPTTPGRWTLRTSKMDGPGYAFEVLGVADDFAEADGQTILNYQQALAIALGKDTADPRRISIADALDRWARHKSATAGSDKQRQDFESAARRIAAAFPRRTLHSITTHEINNWMHALVAEGGVDPRARRATANRRLATLKSALSRAANEAGYSGPRAWDAAKKFGKADSFGARMIILSPEEEARWISAARPDVADLLRALQQTGARLGEIRSANVGDLNENRLTLSGKTGRRTITLSPDKATWLGRLAAGRAPAEPLIPRGDGTRWPEAGHKNPIEKAARAAGLPDGTTTYALRHGFITRALSRGVPLAAVAAHCGTSAEMIANSYAKFADGDMAEWFK